MRRCVEPGTIADNLINIGLALNGIQLV